MPEARTDFRRGVYEQIRQVDGQQGELTVERMCTLAALSRASYYRYCGPQPADDEEESRLRDDMQRIALANRYHRYRRITHALRAQGWEITHKRLARLMRLDNLLAIRKRRFAPVTTDSKHDLEVSINVARRLTPTAINQLWVADTTYVRLGRSDLFLAVFEQCVDVSGRSIWASSTGGCNTFLNITSKKMVKRFSRRFPAQRLPRPGVDCMGNSIQFIGRMKT